MATEKLSLNTTTTGVNEVIYFLMIDRFHDGRIRSSQSPGRGRGYGEDTELKKSIGGNIQGIIAKLPYIKDLGSTAVWLTPFLENNPQSYHGYSIQHFLKVDPRFGTEEDLILLVQRAHEIGLKVYLDVVVNHSGDNWFYKKDAQPFYHRGVLYPFGGWRSADYPQPESLRNPDYYFKKGRINNWDQYPETRQGDFFELKKFRLDESPEGLEVQKQLAEIYKYWLSRTNCDGFRIDAAKHIGEQAVARFCTEIRSHAHSIGKNEFFLFAEIPATDQFSFSFFKPIEKDKKVFFGPDTILDFPLHFLLRKVVTGKTKASILRKRYESLESHFLQLGIQNFQLITFLDNHDQIENPNKRRIASGLTQEQLIAAWGMLFTLPGIPCLYYGTEQALVGEGNGDHHIREAMFDFKDPSGPDLFDTTSNSFQVISKLIKLREENPELFQGSLEWHEFKVRSLNQTEPVVFSRKLGEVQSTICFNPDNEKAEILVKLNESKHSLGQKPNVIFSNINEDVKLQLLNVDKSFYLQVVLSPEEFIILK